MRYFEIYAWTECPFCVNAKELLAEKDEQFMFCCIDQSDKLLDHFKNKYKHNTGPMILLKNTENNHVEFIGGYTDLVKYLGDEKGGES